MTVLFTLYKRLADVFDFVRYFPTHYARDFSDKEYQTTKNEIL